ncbi:MAG: hypothetical protein A2142_06380 [candidate division Zixibacteria bacterium RBG_16_48_11]|nr:MAG: hypothetical protein A2142_06380 [candidate division Zixibacteria bacterium RBG_16_48_11]
MGHKPTEQQQNIINHSKGHALVIAGPGSGKTFSLLGHVGDLILTRSLPSENIWVMAFNRDISAKLRESLYSMLKEQSPKTTTIHTFILEQTLRWGSQLLNGSQVADSLGDFGLTTLMWKPITNRLKSVHGLKTGRSGKQLTTPHSKNVLWAELRDYWLTNQKPTDTLFLKFESEFTRLTSIYKLLFLDELAKKFLDAMVANPGFRKDVARQIIVIDEFQDLNPTEHAILRQLKIEGSYFIVFGDDDQAVNDFRRAHADFIRDFITEFNPIKYPLARDRRCPKIILELADSFVEGLPRIDKSAGFAPHQGHVEVLCFKSDIQEESSLPKLVMRYLTAIGEIKCAVNPEILILASGLGRRRGSRIADIIMSLRESGIQDVTGDRKEDPLDTEWGLAFKSLSFILAKGFSSMHMAAWLSATQSSSHEAILNYIEKEEKKGNRVDFLGAVSLLASQDKSIANLLLNLQELTKQFNSDDFSPQILFDIIPFKLDGRDEGVEFVLKIWQEFLTQDSNVEDVIKSGESSEIIKGKRFFNHLMKYLTEYLRAPQIGRVHVTTYRKAKGLEASLVIVTSVDMTEFPDDSIKRRLLYVAVTRSRKNLILTFAAHRTGSRRFARSRSSKAMGKSREFRSALLPSKYSTTEYSDSWFNNWTPAS